jgi:hypothetical protein
METVEMTLELWIGTENGLHRLPGGDPLFAGRSITALAGEGAALWAIADGKHILRSTQGRGWETIAELAGLRATCLLPHPHGLLVGTSEAHLFKLADGELQPVPSFEEAPTRGDWFTPWGGPPDVRSMSMGPQGSVYVNVHVGGILHAPSDLSAWRATVDLACDVHQVLYHEPSGHLLAPCGWGLGLSQDGGDTWQFEDQGLHGRYLRAVAVAGDTLLISASTGPRTSQGALYRKPLSSPQPFEKCHQGLPEWFPANIDTHCLVATGDSAAFGSAGGKVFLSEDWGMSWSLVSEGLAPVGCLLPGSYSRTGIGHPIGPTPE